MVVVDTGIKEENLGVNPHTDKIFYGTCELTKPVIMEKELTLRVEGELRGAVALTPVGVHGENPLVEIQLLNHYYQIGEKFYFR
jgi:hypothetical protein